MWVPYFTRLEINENEMKKKKGNKKEVLGVRKKCLGKRVGHCMGRTENVLCVVLRPCGGVYCCPPLGPRCTLGKIYYAVLF